MSDQDTQTFYDFQNHAVDLGLGYCNKPYDSSEVSLFSFVYNPGDFYTLQDPHKIRELVIYARAHANANKADYYARRDGYGLLDHFARRSALESKDKFVIWDVYGNHDPDNYISLFEWLKENGCPVA